MTWKIVTFSHFCTFHCKSKNEPNLSYFRWIALNIWHCDDSLQEQSIWSETNKAVSTLGAFSGLLVLFCLNNISQLLLINVNCYTLWSLCHLPHHILSEWFTSSSNLSTHFLLSLSSSDQLTPSLSSPHSPLVTRPHVTGVSWLVAGTSVKCPRRSRPAQTAAKERI